MANEDWSVEVTVAMPDCPSLAAAYEKVATPSKAKEWRSSDFAKLKVTMVGDATEPLKTDDSVAVHAGPLTMKITVVEGSPEKNSEGMVVYDAMGGGCCGLIKVRGKFSFFEENGVIMGRAQEKHISGRCFFPKVETVKSEHETMFKELNDLFKNESGDNK